MIRKYIKKQEVNNAMREAEIGERRVGKGRKKEDQGR